VEVVQLAATVTIDGYETVLLEDGRIVVASRTVPGHWYTVDGAGRCSCMGFRLAQDCHHQKIAAQRAKQVLGP
jgi:hypothetical protein